MQLFKRDWMSLLCPSVHSKANLQGDAAPNSLGVHRIAELPYASYSSEHMTPPVHLDINL